MTTVALYSCFALIIFTCMCVVQGNTSVKFRASKNRKIENLVNKTIATDGLVTCVVLCKSETAFQCESASWGDGTCLLSETVAIHIQYNTVENENWTTMLRVVYPVFHARGDLGTYSLTFVAAQLECEKSGSRIASRQNLLNARALGFQFCACGWLSDRTVGYVMQASHPGCGYSNGIIGCSGPSDVYCIV